MKYRLKSRAQELCDRSSHKYEMTIDGYLMVRRKDCTGYDGAFNEEDLPQGAEIDLCFIKEEE